MRLLKGIGESYGDSKARGGCETKRIRLRGEDWV